MNSTESIKLNINADLTDNESLKKYTIKLV